MLHAIYSTENTAALRDELLFKYAEHREFIPEREMIEPPARTRKLAGTASRRRLNAPQNLDQNQAKANGKRWATVKRLASPSRLKTDQGEAMTDQTALALVPREELIAIHVAFFRFSILIGHVGQEALAAEMNETAETLMTRTGISCEEVLTAYEASHSAEPPA